MPPLHVLTSPNTLSDLNLVRSITWIFSASWHFNWLHWYGFSIKEYTVNYWEWPPGFLPVWCIRGGAALSPMFEDPLIKWKQNGCLTLKPTTHCWRLWKWRVWKISKKQVTRPWLLAHHIAIRWQLPWFILTVHYIQIHIILWVKNVRFSVICVTETKIVSLRDRRDKIIDPSLLA